MNVIRDKIEGDVLLDQDTELRGMIVGDTELSSGKHLDLRGMLVGNLSMMPNSSATVYGMVNGKIVNSGGMLEIFGTVNGTVIHRAGETVIDTKAIVDRYIREE